MAASQRTELERLAQRCPGARIVEFTDQLPEILKLADLVVTMGGYNTLCEIVSIGVPALVVPRIEPRREQLLRTRAFADLGLVSMLHPDDLTAETLVGRVSELIDDGPTVRARTQCAVDTLEASGGLSGLEVTVGAIADLIGQASPAYARVRVAS
jgi:predicted glycosyltransferase